MSTWDSNYLLRPPMKLISSCKGCTINNLNSSGPGRESKMHSADSCTFSTPLMVRQCLNKQYFADFGWVGNGRLSCSFYSDLKLVVCFWGTLRLLIVFINSYRSAYYIIFGLVAYCFCCVLESSSSALGSEYLD